MLKWESKPFRKIKERGPGIKKWQEEWIWEPVTLDSSGQKVAHKIIGKILNDDIYECGFCKGRGERPRGTKCSVCGGKGVVSVNPPAVICAYCKGSGEEKRCSNLTCTVCKGKGVIHVREPVERCAHCRGTGAEQTNKLPCSNCRGSGVVTVKEDAGRNTCTSTNIESHKMKPFSFFKPAPSPLHQSRLEQRHKKKSYHLPSGSEKKALEIIYEMEAADSVAIARRMGISPSYAGYLCKSLFKQELLIWNCGRYLLSVAGKRLMKKRNKVAR